MIPQSEEKYTSEELALMKTQDLKYVRLKLSTETKVSDVPVTVGIEDLTYMVVVPCGHHYRLNTLNNSFQDQKTNICTHREYGCHSRDP